MYQKGHYGLLDHYVLVIIFVEIMTKTLINVAMSQKIYRDTSQLQHLLVNNEFKIS